MITYELRGSVNHIGSSTDKGNIKLNANIFSFSNLGHYTALVKRNHWLQCDDSDVKEIDETRALEKISRTGYIFFYENVEDKDLLFSS